MRKWCPEKQGYALYLDCLECDDYVCEQVPTSPREKKNGTDGDSVELLSYPHTEAQ